jgi:superfamily II DNA or RNA helicase
MNYTEIQEEDNLNNIDLSFITWSKSKTIEKDGKVLSLRTASANQKFWELWKSSKEDLKNLGISCGKTPEGVWQIKEWKTIKESVIEKKDRILPESIQLKYEDKLISYQIEHTKKLIASLLNNNSALDGSDTGTGKTYTALCLAKELELKPIIICPKSVIQSWKNACKYFEIDNYFVSNYEQYKNENTEYLKKENDNFIWNIRENEILIYDEVHRAKNYKTINSEILWETKKQNCKIIALSATIADNPMQMYSLGYILGLFNSKSGFWSWAKSNGCCQAKYGWEFNGSKEILKTIHDRVYPWRGDRTSIATLGDLFPENLIIANTFEMNEDHTKIEKIYKEMERELSELRKKSEYDSSLALTILLRARQQIELIKVPIFVEQAQDAIEEGRSVVVFVNFNETTMAIAEKLNTNCIVWGDNKLGERDKNIEDFQSDKSRIIICNIKAGGVGISLHDLNGNFPRLSLISPTWSAQDLLQALGRIHRAGGKSKSIQKIIFAANTVEESVCEIVKSKINNIHTLNDGDLVKISNFFNF